MLGNGRLEGFCFDGVNRLCHIRGKLRKRVWIGCGEFRLRARRPRACWRARQFGGRDGSGPMAAWVVRGRVGGAVANAKGERPRWLTRLLCLRLRGDLVPLTRLPPIFGLAGDIILLGLREFQDQKADIIMKYDGDEARSLKTYGELPESVQVPSLLISTHVFGQDTPRTLTTCVSCPHTRPGRPRPHA